jgi:hypothetical protein
MTGPLQYVFLTCKGCKLAAGIAGVRTLVLSLEYVSCLLLTNFMAFRFSAHFRFIFVGLILMVLGGVCRAQQGNNVILSGKVTDEKTGKPLPFANVFINNSTIGTTADENGNYQLGNLEIGSLDIGVSFLGYETIRQALRFEQGGRKVVMFKMREGAQLEGVTIYARKNSKREKYIKTITKQLLGEGPFSKLCKILNTEVLEIHMEDDGHLTARSTKPLIIENNALGYRIFQDLDDFDYYAGKVYYGGSTRFEHLTPKDKTNQALWRTNQKRAYKGSLKHLLTSMVTDSLAEQGFRVYQTIPDSVRKRYSMGPVYSSGYFRDQVNRSLVAVRGAALIQPGELPTERLVVSGTRLDIFNANRRGRSPYPDMAFAYTQMTMPSGYIVITPQGWVVMPMNFEIAGDLGNDRFSSLLPADWNRHD